MIILDLISEHVHKLDAGCFQNRHVINLLALSNLKIRYNKLLQVVIDITRLD